MILKYAQICLKYKLKSLYKLRSIYRYKENSGNNLKWSRRERLAKTNFSMELFPKNILIFLTWM